MNTFDDIAEIEESERKKLDYKPFWKVDHKDERDLLEWLNLHFHTLKKASEDREQRLLENVCAYRGIEHKDINRVDRARAFSDSPRRSRLRQMKLQVNNLYDITEQNVSRETRYRPAAVFNPGDSFEHDDLMAAKVVEDINEGIWDREHIDSVLQKNSRVVRIAGESYIFIGWDENKGPYHPDWVKAVFKEEKIEYKENMPEREIRKKIKEIGKIPSVKIKDDDGNEIKITEPIRIGQETYRVVLPIYVLLDPKETYEECQYAFYYEYEHIDTLKEDYPDKADRINKDDEIKAWDYDTLQDKALSNHALVIYFWHKSTDKLDGGRYVKFIRGCILENDVNEFAECDATNGFPWVRRVDVQVPGLLHGVASIEFGRPLADWISKLSTMLVRQQALAAHPKWAAPRNSVKVENLANETSVMWYTGPQPPQLMQPNPGAANTFNLIEVLDKKLQQVMGVFGVSRGEPPAGVKAGVALQFLNEQENERANSQIQNHNLTIAQLAKLTIFNAGIKYDESDKRLEGILGPKKWQLAKYFEMANLTRNWDVKAQTASALPQQKAQRIQTIIELKKEFPERVDDDEALDMIGFGNADKFVSINTANIRAAESENDDILRRGKATPPEVYEDHLKHYEIHLRKLNEPELKDGTIRKSKTDALKEHVAMHEMFLLEMVKKMPAYGQLLLEKYPLFPMFYEDLESEAVMQAAIAPPAPPEEQAPPAQPQGQGLQAPPQEAAAGIENITPVGGVV
jgi:hypothetical protein